MGETVLEMKNICKQFSGTKVLIDSYLKVEKGEVVGLLGENGAGKSTLMKILAGIYSKDSGDIFIEGNKTEIKNVVDSHDKGISIIHQELVLIPHMTVAENIFVGREPVNSLRIVKKKEMVETARDLLKSFNLDIDPESKVYTLNIAQQQLVEIAQALSFNSKILVMDEPTSSLTENETEFLFNTITELRDKGIGIIYISHRMPELFKITDKISVMRDGMYVGTKVTKETNVDELISMMVGRTLTDLFKKSDVKFGKKMLEVKNLSRKKSFDDISFSVREGEILGFSGLVGSGRSEIMKAIFGLDPKDSGEIFVDDKKVVIKKPMDAMNLGIALVPESRKDEGLILQSSVGYNITLRVLKDFIKGIRVNKRKEENIIDEYVNKLSIKTTSNDRLVGLLSGGNQQKVLISKWLAAKPKILILDEPTRGVDVGAKAEIYNIINTLALEGISIIMISSDLPEVINMSDRIVIVAGGKISGILEKSDFSQESIMHLATGGE